jgi:hypothetical protein
MGIRSFIIVLVVCTLSVISTLWATSPVWFPCSDETYSWNAVSNNCEERRQVQDVGVHMTIPNEGLERIDQTSSNGIAISEADELDAIRMELNIMRRFMVALGGMFFGWMCMTQLFKAH